MTGKINDIPIPLVRSKKALKIIHLHIIDDLKVKLLPMIDYFNKEIIIKPLKDSFINNEEKRNREFLTEMFDILQIEIGRWNQNLFNIQTIFRETCNTELEQYGRLILGVSLNIDDDLNYTKELKFALSNDDLIDTSERRYLNRSKLQYNLSETRAEELENNAILENESFKKNED